MQVGTDLGKAPKHLRRILVVPTPYRRDVVSKCGSYPRAVELGKPTTAVHRNLRRHGLANWQPQTLSALLAVMEPAPARAVFWDVGAHIGVHSALVTAVYRGKQIRAFAFEPTPDTARRARSIATRNELPIRVVWQALSDQSGTTSFFLSTKAETSNSLNADFREHAGEVEVQTTTLNEAASRFPTPFAVKVDVETLEHKVLSGGLGMIETVRPWIVCEVLAGDDRGQVIAVLQQLRELGYELHPITKRPPWPTWTGGDLPDPEDVRDWLLAPEPIGRPFFKRVAAWDRAIRRCGPERNELLRRSLLTEGWSADHPVPAVTRLRRRVGRLLRHRGA
jgi:FkbM family methyltransferase